MSSSGPSSGRYTGASGDAPRNKKGAGRRKSKNQGNKNERSATTTTSTQNGNGSGNPRDNNDDINANGSESDHRDYGTEDSNSTNNNPLITVTSTSIPIESEVKSPAFEPTPLHGNGNQTPTPDMDICESDAYVTASNTPADNNSNDSNPGSLPYLGFDSMRDFNNANEVAGMTEEEHEKTLGNDIINGNLSNISSDDLPLPKPSSLANNNDDMDDESQSSTSTTNLTTASLKVNLSNSRNNSQLTFESFTTEVGVGAGSGDNNSGMDGDNEYEYEDEDVPEVDEESPLTSSRSAPPNLSYETSAPDLRSRTLNLGGLSENEHFLTSTPIVGNNVYSNFSSASPIRDAETTPTSAESTLNHTSIQRDNEDNETLYSTKVPTLDKAMIDSGSGNSPSVSLELDRPVNHPSIRIADDVNLIAQQHAAEQAQESQNQSGDEEVEEINSSQGLPNTVTELVGRNGMKVYVVGTAHFSRKSQMDVIETIQKVQPTLVVLELCAARRNILTLDEETILREASDLNFEKMRATVRQSGVVQGALHLLLLSMSASLTRKLGMAPGGEFRVAVTEAQKIPGCGVLLGDRIFTITLSRALASLTFFQKLKLGWQFLTSTDDITKEDIEACKEKDLLEKMLCEMTGEYPAMSRVFVDERDAYLSHSLWLAAHNGTNPGPIVGVVGMGHVRGIVKKWGTVTQKEVNEVNTPPVTSYTSVIIRSSLKFTFYAVLTYGAYKASRRIFNFPSNELLDSIVTKTAPHIQNISDKVMSLRK